jgi:2',3'-cyclic-nucleotide 2'-phosphodiesterase (5'-nucleotidase family)
MLQTSTTMKKHYLLLLLLLCTACKTNLSVTNTNLQNISISSETAQNAKIESLIAPYKLQIDASMQKVIGQSTKELRCERTDLESTLGNFIVDLMHYQTSKIYDVAIDMCVVNNGGLRVPINAGNITVGNIFELMPFENEVMVVTMTGKDLQALFAYEAKHRKTSFSNTQLRYTEEGQLVSAKIAGKEINPTQIYKIVSYDYLLNGGDGMTCFAGLQKEPMGVTVRTMIMNHIAELQAKGEKADGNIESRVVFRD